MYRTPTGGPTNYYTIRNWTYRLFAAEKGGRIGYFTDLFIMILIAVNVGAVMLETVDVLSARHGELFYWFEIFSVITFTIEYVARIWSAVEHSHYNGMVIGRLSFASRPLLIVDLLAILPFYLAMVGVGADLRFLRSLRLVRLLRLLKLARYSKALQALAVVLHKKKPDIMVALYVDTILLVVASSCMYYVESQAQPDVFTSIPQTLWWGVVTLTTVGYGDVVPVTLLGQLFGALTAVLGIGMFALPASILASGFVEFHVEDEEYECPHCKEPISPDEL